MSLNNKKSTKSDKIQEKLSKPLLLKRQQKSNNDKTPTNTSRTSNTEFEIALETITGEVRDYLDFDETESICDETRTSPLMYQVEYNSVVEEINFSETGSEISSNVDSSCSSGENTDSSTTDSDLKHNIRYPIRQLLRKTSPEFLHSRQGLLIILPERSHVYFHGLMSVKILHGGVEILGYTLTTSLPPQELYSPRGSSLLCIKNSNYDEKVKKSFVQESLLKEKFDSSEISSILNKIKTTNAVIFCKKINSFKINFLLNHIAQQIFPNSMRFPCDFNIDKTSANVLNIHPELDSIISNIHKNSKILLSGGKGVGKSTSLRYIVNKLLMKYKEVLVLDLDPGQPEFTVPGCLSASIVTDPVFGPNYTHLREPYRCVFISSVDISSLPLDYINKTKMLILLCKDLPRMPIIVNYMGFTRGFGLNIFSSIVGCVKPTLIVEIRSSNLSKNFKQPLTSSLIHEFALTLTPQVRQIPTFEIVTISSMADENKGWMLEPRKIREMCVLCYFGTMFSNVQKYITDITTHIYKTNFSSVNIIYNERTGSPATVNGNLVALCKYFSDHNGYVCYGWGIVRGVDYDKKVLYIITPMNIENLELVDSLVLGSVTLPPSMYMASHSVTGLIPYVSKGILPTLGKIPKRSYLPTARSTILRNSNSSH